MGIYASKTQKDKSVSNAKQASQIKNNDTTNSQFLDNRPEAIAHRKLQEMAAHNQKAKQVSQLQPSTNNNSTQQDSALQQRENNTGLPNHLKTGIENLSGYSMDDVKVHYNSDKPKQLQALAYAQGTNIHLAPGQEQHLPHEAWHVVQQKQGRVQPTIQMKSGVRINDDIGLEKEADEMGKIAFKITSNKYDTSTLNTLNSSNNNSINAAVQGVFMYGSKKDPGPRMSETTYREIVKAWPEGGASDLQKFEEAYFTEGVSYFDDYFNGSKKFSEQIKSDQYTKLEDVEASVGLELTFENKFTQKNLKEGKNISPEAVKVFERFLSALKSGCLGASKSHYDEYELKVKSKPQVKDIFKNTSPNNLTFTFKFNSEYPDYGDLESWWFNISFDPGVIEVQTAPVPAKQFDEGTLVSNIIDEYIFGVLLNIDLNDEKLKHAAETGGGHINIDLNESGIKTSPELVELLIIWSQVSKKLQSELDLLEKTHTAALLGDDRHERKSKGNISKLTEKAEAGPKFIIEIQDVLKAKNLAEAKSKLNELFFNFPHQGMVREKEGFMSESLNLNSKDLVNQEKNLAIHNQAINIEHVDAKDESTRRLEFRNIRAQENLKEIRQSILMCMTAIEVTKKKGLDNKVTAVIEKINLMIEAMK